MLAVPRPRTRGDCLAEARPCPWVGCRHHLLLEVEQSRRDPPQLVLNTPQRRHDQRGRRRGLRSSAAEALVQVWLDDALELLTRMRFTCALDVVDAYPWGITARASGELLGITTQTAHHRTARSLVRLRLGLTAEDHAV